MNSISLDKPYLLLIAVPLILLFTIPFAIAIRKENRNGHNIASQILHVLMAVVIAFAAAGPTITTVLTETEVFVVADVSYSAKRNLNTIDDYIKNLELPENTKLGLICFGKDYQLVSKLADPRKVSSVKKATVDDTETNIAEALEFAGTQFGNGAIKRIVLITDGKQTDTGDANAIRRAVEGLDKKDIKVDAIYLDDNPSPDSKEVQISGVEFTETAYLDSEQYATVEVQSSYDTTATLTLTCDGLILADQEADLSIGRNSVNVKLDTSVAGTFDYEVAIEADEDINIFNNSCAFTQSVSDEMNILVITQSFTDCTAAITRYGEKGVVDIYENDKSTPNTAKNSVANRYADSETIKIHLNTSTVPYTIEDLCRYDEIILADVDITTLDNYSEFIKNLDDAVAVFGKSLITFGNLHIQNTDEEELKQLGDILPVKFGNTDSKLYTIIVDTSRSMFQLDHLNIAKQLVTRMVNSLEESAYFTLLTFNSDAEVIQPVTPISNRDEILAKVENFEVIQGTVLGSGLRRTLEYISPLAFDDKQVLLITDGLSYSIDVEDDPVEVAKEMLANGIVTSVFDVGRPGDSKNGTNPFVPEYTAAYYLLSDVAKAGDGKHYYSRNLERLDDVTFGEMADDMTVTEVVREATVSVQRLQQNDPVLEGLVGDDKLSIPNVNGYVYCGSKPSATTVLTINHKRKEDSVYTTEKPLYAYQNYGEGRVSTFTSAFGGNWVKSWNGKIGERLFDNFFKLSVPAEKHVVPYTVNILKEGKTARIEVQPTIVYSSSEAWAEIEIVLTDGEILSEKMYYSGELYYFELDISEVGRYAINITYKHLKDSGATEEYTTPKNIYISFIDEYDAFSVFEPSPLYRALEKIGTVSEDGNLKLDNTDGNIDKYVQEFTAPLLITVVVLFVVDVLVRTLKWDDIKSFFGISKNKKKKEDKKQ